MKGFIDFVREKGVIGLAVGFLLGGAITKLVSSLVTDIVNPVVGIFLGSTKGLENAYIPVFKTKIMYGHFISVLLDFIIVAAVVYFGVKGLGLEKLDKKKEAK